MKKTLKDFAPIALGVVMIPALIQGGNYALSAFSLNYGMRTGELPTKVREQSTDSNISADYAFSTIVLREDFTLKDLSKCYIEANRPQDFFWRTLGHEREIETTIKDTCSAKLNMTR